MKGSYILLIKLDKQKKITIGKLGERCFDKGHYIYVGSALNGLEQRIQRHRRKEKKLHWHIDYFLQKAEIISVFYKENILREECEIAKTFSKHFPNVAGFGCSDCRCKSHLFTGPLYQIHKIIQILDMKKANA